MRDDHDHQDFVDGKRRNRMATVDVMPSGIRDCVHEYGLNVVTALLQCGVKKPNQIRHVVETVLNEFSPTRGATSTQGARRAPGFSGDL